MKFSTTQMIPLKKEISAYWVGEGEYGPNTVINCVSLPVGTPWGYWQWVGHSDVPIVTFVAMPEAGIFNRYRILISEE